MSVELDWTLLDASLSQTLLTAINRAFAAAKRPAFVGELTASALDFGTEPPGVDLVHLGDIDTLFLDRTDNARASLAAAAVPVPAPAPAPAPALGPSASAGLAQPQHPLPPPRARRPQHHKPPPDSVLGSPLGSGSMLGIGYASGLHTPRGPHHHHHGHGHGHHGHHGSSTYLPQAAIIAAAMRAQALDREAARAIPAPPTRQPSVTDVRTRLPVSGFPSPLDEIDDPTRPPPPGNSATAPPSLQIHLRTRWRSTTVRCHIHTSLVINVPSPSFMSLDVNISLVGLVFNGVLILAIEGEKRKMHISIMEQEDEDEDEDDEDEDGDESGSQDGQGHASNGMSQSQQLPARLGRSFTTADLSLSLSPPPANGDISLHSANGDTRASSPLPPPQKPRPLLPPDPELSPLASRTPLPSTDPQASPLNNQAPRPPPPPFRSQSAHPYLLSSSTASFFPHPLPATPGARLLPSLTLESSVGEQDKHVLRNVGKVEKFVQDMVRKVIEDQLLYPNFKTVDLKKNPKK
ncbi:Mitochondrial distribution and morphology protein 12 [Tilletia horrida]|uniref:Mitochondrial distribution and morphology protein 12 n=1 Tax=Tilletia horrida TaxID=155126 RepID=A0AAN6GAW7_9BASI|nr:Mitochondrial distribution and morphology protein 12 [Tilletia horrida]